MKNILFPLIFLPLLAFAQTPPFGGRAGGADMQKMMQQAQQMAVCMKDLDQDRLEELSRQAKAVSKDIEALCANGDEAGALKKALDYSREMRDDPELQKLQECTRGMSSLMAQVMPVNPAEIESRAERGICD